MILLLEVELLEIMTCTLIEKIGVLISFKVEFGNKLLIIIILENNMQEKVLYMILQKINLYVHNLMVHGH